MTTFFITVALTAGVTVIAVAQSHKSYPATTVEMTIAAPIDSVFNHIVPVNLSHIFKKYKNLPAVIKTDENERWVRPGLTRTVYFEDKSTARETLLTVVPYTCFSYRIDNFTSGLRFLARRIEGNWLFKDTGNGQTQIVWTYTIIPKNIFSRGLIHLLLLKNVNGLLKNALLILKADLESAQAPGSSR